MDDKNQKIIFPKSLKKMIGYEVWVYWKRIDGKNIFEIMAVDNEFIALRPVYDPPKEGEIEDPSCGFDKYPGIFGDGWGSRTVIWINLQDILAIELEGNWKPEEHE